MRPINKIIAPYDFSGPSDEGLNQAIDFAEHFGSELLLIHVIELPRVMPPVGPPASPGFAKDKLVQEIRDSAAAKLNEIQKERFPAGLQSRVILTEGVAADEIARIAEEENADMIVIATHGWAGWRRFIFGSVTEKVVRLATCQVLIVPEPGE